MAAPRISRGYLFLAVFFRVTHDGLSKKGITYSLLATAYQEHKAQVKKSSEVSKGAGRDQRFRIFMNPGTASKTRLYD